MKPMDDEQPDELRKEIRRIFERHTMPEVGDPELTMFDTDAIIDDLGAWVAQHTKEAVRSARIDELKALLNAEVIKPQYHNVYVQHIKEMEK